MLTYQQIEMIAALLNWTAGEVENAIAELNSGFMRPCVDVFASNPENNEDEPGFYHRLSAQGYMDCTEWVGPFETEEEAAANMLSMYADY